MKMSAHRDDPAEKNLDVSDFYASPRHSWWFLSNEDEQQKIFKRVDEMRATKGAVERDPDQGVIINIQGDPPIVEVHDGNASAVAWVLYRRISGGLSTSWEDFSSACQPPPKAVLSNRKHPEKDEVWHPFVPREVASDDAARKSWFLRYCCWCRICVGKPRCDPLRDAPESDEKGKLSKMAVTRGGRPVYFNNTDYFDGENKSETIGHIADKIQNMPEFQERFKKENETSV